MGKAWGCREKVVLKHLLGPMEPLSAILYPLRRRVSRPPGAALHLRRALAGATKALVQKCLLNFLSAAGRCGPAPDPGARGRSENAAQNQRHSADTREWYAQSSCGAACPPTCVDVGVSWARGASSSADSFRAQR